MSDLSSPQTPAGTISAVILAGGAGRRVQGADKGLISWRGKMLVEHVIERVRPQARELFISCNRNREAYGRLAPLTPADFRSGFQGPLAGLEAARESLQGEYLLLVPCDMPLLPTDLGSRLLSSLQDQPHYQACYAATRDSEQYLCALLRVDVLHSLPCHLDNGLRAVRHWYREIGAVAVDFDEQRESFLNLNELHCAED